MKAKTKYIYQETTANQADVLTGKTTTGEEDHEIENKDVEELKEVHRDGHSEGKPKKKKVCDGVLEEEGEENDTNKDCNCCCSRVNMKLLVFKSFYFFVFAAIGSLFPYLAVYYKQILLSARQTGILIGIRPLINLCATPMWGAVADTYKASKFIFVLSLVSWLVSNYSLSLVAPAFHVGVCLDNETVTIAEDVLSNLEHSLTSLNLTYIRDARDLNISKKGLFQTRYKLPKQSNNGTSTEQYVLASKNEILIIRKRRNKQNEWKSRNTSISEVSPYLQDNKEQESPHQHEKENNHNILDKLKKQLLSRRISKSELVKTVLSAVSSQLNASISGTREISQIYQRELTERIFDYLNMQGHYPWPLDTVINYEQTQESDEWDKDRHSHLFTVLLIITVTGTLFSAPAFTLADTATLRKLGESKKQYGKQRMWGALGWGLGAFVVGASLSYIQELRRCNNPLSVDYTPCFYAFAILMGVAILIGGLFEFDDTKRKEVNLWEGAKTFFNCKYIYFILTILFCGSCLGFLQTFLFWHLLDMGGTQFLFSAISAVQCASEFVMYNFSGSLIHHFGYQCIFYAGLLGYAIRFFLYAVITNSWLVLPLEVLHGLSYAAVWSAAVVYVGLIPSASNTMQGILGGVHWGLGYGLGGVLGGLLVSWVGTSYTFVTFGILSLLDLIFFVLLNNWKCSFRGGNDTSTAEYALLGEEAMTAADESKGTNN